MKVCPIKQMGCDAGSLRRSKIALLVAYHEASIDIYRKSFKQSFDHPRLWLAAVAEDTVPGNQTIGVMRAKLERIDMCTNNSKLARHPFVQIANMPLLVKSPGDS